MHVGGNHFITITKNEDGTFTKSDINKPAERLTEEELKVAIEREYGLKEDETTTVLVKRDNEKFKGIKRVDNLSEVLGAERVWDSSQLEGKSQEQYYRDYGENSYEMLMKQMYGTTNLTPEQSREFAAFYEEFLKAAILSIDKTISDEKASEESKEKAKALKSQAAKELAIIEATLEVLRENPDGVVSGQIGQVLLTEHRAYPNQNQDIPDGEYYQVITIYADDLKEQYSITGADGKTVSIESYRISKGSSISTREGVRVTRSDGSTYEVFGIAGSLKGWMLHMNIS
ncbi:MAG: hypothetical protein LBC22_05440 [Endomicrobium sp.]|nr:hypothetical protein [Endomicrobium sp.]